MPELDDDYNAVFVKLLLIIGASICIGLTVLMQREIIEDTTGAVLILVTSVVVGIAIHIIAYVDAKRGDY